LEGAANRAALTILPVDALRKGIGGGVFFKLFNKS
jgi:hypothetical protein